MGNAATMSKKYVIIVICALVLLATVTSLFIVQKNMNDSRILSNDQLLDAIAVLDPSTKDIYSVSSVKNYGGGWYIVTGRLALPSSPYDVVFVVFDNYPENTSIVAINPWNKKTYPENAPPIPDALKRDIPESPY
ncbi:MAG: hypothetical protein WAQ25_00545 [Candidatus Saccharimonas sp.]